MLMDTGRRIRVATHGEITESSFNVLCYTHQQEHQNWESFRKTLGEHLSCTIGQGIVQNCFARLMRGGAEGALKIVNIRARGATVERESLVASPLGKLCSQPSRKTSVIRDIGQRRTFREHSVTTSNYQTQLQRLPIFSIRD